MNKKYRVFLDELEKLADLPGGHTHNSLGEVLAKMTPEQLNSSAGKSLQARFRGQFLASSFKDATDPEMAAEKIKALRASARGEQWANPNQLKATREALGKRLKMVDEVNLPYDHLDPWIQRYNKARAGLPDLSQLSQAESSAFDVIKAKNLAQQVLENQKIREAMEATPEAVEDVGALWKVLPRKGLSWWDKLKINFRGVREAARSRVEPVAEKIFQGAVRGEPAVEEAADIFNTVAKRNWTPIIGAGLGVAAAGGLGYLAYKKYHNES